MHSVTLSTASFIFVLLKSLLTLPFVTPCTDKIYAGTGSGHLAISTDAGETWTTLALPASYPVKSIASVGDHIYVGTLLDGIAVSHDGGTTWKRPKLDSQIHSVYSVFAIGNRVYAGVKVRGGAKFCISNDNGETWPINIRFNDTAQEYQSVNAIYVDGNKIFIGTDSKGLGISEDDGNTWKYMGVAQGLYDPEVTGISVVGSKIFLANDAKMTMSENGGKTWRHETVSSSYVKSVLAAKDNVYATSFGAGISLSADGGKTWVAKGESDGLAGNVAQSVAIDQKNNVYVGTTKGLSISSDNGITWRNKNTSHGLPSSDVIALFIYCD